MLKNNNIKKLSLILAVAVVPTLFTSCSKDISKDKQNLLDEYIDLGNQTDYSSSSIYADIGSSWLSPETEYICYGMDSSDNIPNNSGNYFLCTNDRLYYQTRIYYNNSTNFETTYAYVSLKTGQYSSLCPDPMCTHLDGSGCKYMNLESLMLSDQSSDIFYGSKWNDDGTISICRIDVQKDSIEVIYNEKTTFLRFTEIFDGKLYFKTILHEKIRNEDNEVLKQVITKRKVLDLTTNRVETIEDEAANELLSHYICSDGTHIYFHSSDQHRVYATDLNFENEKTIFEYDENHSVLTFKYDTGTEELYFWYGTRGTILSDVVHGKSDAEIDGSIYKINKNLECEPLPMASDQILDYKITNNYIYYTVCHLAAITLAVKTEIKYTEQSVLTLPLPSWSLTVTMSCFLQPITHQMIISI